MSGLESLADDLFIATRPLPIWSSDIGARMTVVRSAGGGLLLHSPVSLDDALREALDALGPVRWIVGPSKAHHMFLGEYVAAYPEAKLAGAPGLAEKRQDLAFDHVLDGPTPAGWPPEVALLPIAGAPWMNEVAFLHTPSRTLILTDLAFNVPREGPNRARFFHWLVGATGRFGPHRLIRFGIRDRVAARASIDQLLRWDFDRIVVSHGEILASGGRRRLAEAFDFLGPSGDAL